MDTEQKDKFLKLSWNQEIIESAEVNGEFKIRGIAINETTTSNGHTFIAEELQKSAGSMVGVPLLKDHENFVDNIVGRVFEAEFNEDGKNIIFQARVMDKSMQKMITDGRINSVSIGASVEDIEEKDDGTLIPKGITFKELSLVAVPADQGATFAVALKEAYNTSHSPLNGEKIMMKGGLKQKPMAENEQEQPQEEAPAEEAQSEEAPVEEAKPEEAPAEPEAPAEATESIRKMLREEMKKLLKEQEEEAPAEAPAEEPVAEEPAEEPEEEEVAAKGDIQYAESYGSLRGGAITVVRKY
jgi:hypothetical protein